MKKVGKKSKFWIFFDVKDWIIVMRIQCYTSVMVAFEIQGSKKENILWDLALVKNLRW